MKKLLVIFMISLLTFALFAFSSCAADKKVAILLTGPISDQGWNMMAYNALNAVKDEYGVEIAYNESVAPSDYEEVFRGYALAGYDIIMGHGFQFGDTAKIVSKDFADKYFIVTSTNICQEPNLASLRTNDAESGFLQGIVAGILTKTNKLGYIGGMEIPSIVSQKNAFVAGAKYVNPDVEVITALTGDFHDVAKAKEMARAMIQKGLDILVADADNANLGIVEAARDKGVKILGSTSDFGETYPEIVITSAIEDFSRAFVVIIGEILNGDFEAKPYQLGMSTDTIRLAPFRNFDISEKQKAQIDKIVEQIISGEIDIEKYMEY